MSEQPVGGIGDDDETLDDIPAFKPPTPFEEACRTLMAAVSHKKPVRVTRDEAIEILKALHYNGRLPVEMSDELVKFLGS